MSHGISQALMLVYSIAARGQPITRMKSEILILLFKCVEGHQT